MGFGVRGSEEPAGSSARSLLPCPVAETVWPPSETPHPPPTASGTQYSLAPGFGRFLSLLEKRHAAFLLLRWPTSLGMTASRFIHPLQAARPSTFFKAE